MNRKKYKEAKDISIKYDFPLVKKWRGLKLFWHVWHEPNLCFWITYEGYIDRIINIEETKPQPQKHERYQLMKPVKQKSKGDDEFRKAYAEWRKANAEFRKARVNWEKAYDEYDRAYDDWRETNHNSILQAHAIECPDCKWDGEKLPQMEEA